MDIEQRVQDYWTSRVSDFSTVRKNELKSPLSALWMNEIAENLPSKEKLDILDAGTGTGYFAVILAGMGHRLTGIDFTEAMLKEAEATALKEGVQVSFMKMDAQKLEFPDESFDAVVSRNLTWTLPDPEKAYREWFRVLKKGGILLNFDADYAQNVRNNNQKASAVSSRDIYGHIGVTDQQAKENAEITLAMPASRLHRPDWDVETLRSVGFSSCSADKSAGLRKKKKKDLSDAPMFMIKAVK